LLPQDRMRKTIPIIPITGVNSLPPVVGRMKRFHRESNFEEIPWNALTPFR
jgi:hypothetical protein